MQLFSMFTGFVSAESFRREDLCCTFLLPVCVQSWKAAFEKSSLFMMPFSAPCLNGARTEVKGEGGREKGMTSH